MNAAVVMRKIPDLPVTQHPEVVSGVPVFEGTRVPVSTLFDYLADSYSLDEFLEAFPSVRRDSALSVLQYGQNQIIRELTA